MESNLAVPYATKPSPPADSRLVFYSPNNDDFLFKKQESIIIDCQSGLRCVGLSWKLSRNRFKQPFLTGLAEPLPANRFRIRIPGKKLKPGFFDIQVTLDPGDGNPVPGICTFGYRVDEMPITPDLPPDFKAFWAKGKEQLAQIPLDAQVAPFQTFHGKEIDAYNLTAADLPGDYDPQGHRTEAVESAKVSFAGLGGIRVQGWLAKPVGEGPFPAMLVLPGAGFNARPRPLEHARHGFVALDIQIHGQAVDLPTYPQLPGYSDQFVYSPPQDFYYYHVYLNCIQAINYLASRADVDKTKIVVVGGSQGGRLSICLAGLDSRVAATVAGITHNANLPYQEWLETCNHGVLKDGMERDAPPLLSDTPKLRCLSYYDTMNFAPDIRCPVLMNAGLVDSVSPPYGVFAVYAKLGTPHKQMIPLPGLGHDWSAEFDRRAWRWLDKILDLPTPPTPAATQL